MGLPARDEARNWIGWTVVDREGAEVGACTAVLADDATGLPEWLYVDIDGASAVVPALDADGSGGRVTVTVTRAQVAGAPAVTGSELTQDQESDLYRHYGIDASRETSQTLLPATAGDDGAAAGPPAAAPGTPAEAGTAPADAAALADAPAAGGRGTVGVAVALAAVAGLGVARARLRRPAVPQAWPQQLWSHRPWAPQPPSPVELVAGQVMVVSARARESALHAGRVAAPIAAAAAESARHRAVRAGEGARHLSRVAVPVAVAAAESARHRAVLAGEGARHFGRTAAPIAVSAAESARHRAVLGAEQLRHASRLASSAAAAAVARARAGV